MDRSSVFPHQERGPWKGALQGRLRKGMTKNDKKGSFLKNHLL